MRSRTAYLCLFFLGAVITGCVSRSGLTAVNMAPSYQMSGLAMRPSISIYHTSDYTSKIFFEIESDQLLYVRQNPESSFQAELDVFAFVYRSFDDTQILDSTKITIKDTQNVLHPTTLSGALEIEIPDVRQRDTYVVVVRFFDKKRRLYFDKVTLLHRTDPLHRQNYLLTDADSNVVLSRQIDTNRIYRLFANAEVNTLNVRYYNREFDLATPPFVDAPPLQFNYRADSVFSIPNGGTFKMHNRGFYHFQTDASTHQGFTVFHHYSSFPYITDKRHLVGPMRFVTSNLEYVGMDLKSSDSAKMVIDEFWLRHAGTEERARDQVEEYYQRVEVANQLFSSYKQGWRTDRGVLYVVYGPPTGIYRTLDTETWVYGEEASSLNYTFVFDRMINPFTDNDYQLQRKADYRYGWGLAIEAWRHGRIYDIEDIKRAQDERDQQLRQTAPPYIWY